MIIEVVGKEIEKIKGDFENYLNGLNMVGEISYSQYSELYDEGTKQIQRAYELGKSELEKENAELKHTIATLRQEKDNVSMHAKAMEVVAKTKSDQLTKAKQFIRDFLAVAIDYIDPIDKNYSLIAEGQQLLSEVKK